MTEADHVGALADVLAELLARAPIFHRRELGTTRQHHLARPPTTSGRSAPPARMYERDEVIDALVRRGSVGGEERWVVSDARRRRARKPSR